MSQELPPQINTNDPEPKDQGFMAKLSKSAGAASKLVALQTERTKLNTLTLPAAYRALGEGLSSAKTASGLRRRFDITASLRARRDKTTR